MWFHTEPPPGPPRLRSSLTPSGQLRCRFRLRQLSCCPLLLRSLAVVQHLPLELLGGLVSSLLAAARRAAGHDQQAALALTTRAIAHPTGFAPASDGPSRCRLASLVVADWASRPARKERKALPLADVRRERRLPRRARRSRMAAHVVGRSAHSVVGTSRVIRCISTYLVIDGADTGGAQKNGPRYRHTCELVELLGRAAR